jgi:lactoylglutathione lyase
MSSRNNVFAGGFMSARLDHVNITVKNIDESIEWYGKLFGFERMEGGINQYGRKWAILAVNDSMIAMTEFPKMQSADQDESRGIHKIFHFGLRIDDQMAWRNKVRDFNIQLNYGGEEITYPNSTSWYVYDPSGHEIEVSYSGGEPLRFPKADAK